MLSNTSIDVLLLLVESCRSRRPLAGIGRRLNRYDFKHELVRDKDNALDKLII